MSDPIQITIPQPKRDPSSLSATTCERQSHFANLLIHILATLTVMLSVCGSDARAGTDTIVRIGVLAKRGCERCIEKWSPTAKYLSKRIPGYSFRIVPLDYKEIGQAVKVENVDFILVNPALYVEMEVLYGASRIASLKKRRTRGIYENYGGVVFCRSDRDDIRTYADLKGKSFMAVDPNSFGGWIAGWREMKEKGIDPYRDFRQLLFGGTHDAVVYAVRDGRVDAGTVRTDTLERMQTEGKIRIRDFHVIHEHGGGKVSANFIHSTRLYPEWPMAKLSHTSDELAEKVASELLKMPPDSPAAKAAGCAGWTIPLNYQSVRECLKELRIGPYRDYGKVTLGETVRNYWYLLIIIFASLVAMTSVAVYFVRLSRNLHHTQSELQKELAERKRIEEGLQQAKEAAERESAKLSAMISGMEEGVLFADANDVITEANSYFCRFVGESREEILGKRLEDCNECGGLRDIVLQKVRDYRSGKDNQPLTVQKSVEEKEVILRVQPIYRDNRYDGVVVNIIDVTELIHAKHEAEEATKAKSRFLANMSHEIRTPMTAILGYADLMMDSKMSASERLNCLAVIRRNGEHLLNLINDILDISKIEAGKMEVNPSRCNIPELISDVLSLMRVRAGEKGISLSAEYKGPLPETIYADKARLKQALMNLVSNAIKFTESGGVRLEVSFLPEWRDKEPAVQIKVIDTGVGIKPENLKQLFQPFNQLDPSTSRKFGGTGLGLAITRQLISLMGGEVSAESTYGKGSVFTITIPTGNLEGVKILENPAEAVVQKGSHRQQDLQKELSGVRILLAEDGIDNLRLIRTILQKAGAEVSIAENGRVAVKKAMEKPFDVILMDMQMPEMDGYEATGYLRSKGYHGPIIALTAHAMTSDRDRCLAAGCDDYLSKPIDRSLLISTVAKFAGVGKSEKDESSEVKNNEHVSSDQQDAEQVPEVIYSEYADDEDLTEVIDDFVAGLRKQVEQMQQAASNNDHKTLQRLAHRLKGAGGSYGYPMLTEVARELEEAAKMEQTEQEMLLLRRIADICIAIIRGRRGTVGSPSASNTSEEGDDENTTN